MLRHVAGFELRYQLSAPAFWVTSLIFFLLTFALVNSDNLQLGWGGQVFRNSPYTLALDCMIMGVWAIFILTTFVSNVVVRDEETRFGPIIYATRLSKFDYLFGRFLGAWAAGCLSFLAVPLAVMIASAMPWLDPQTIGPFRPLDYLYVYFVLCVPTLFIIGASFFSLATSTRSMFATYIGALVVLVIYFLATGYFKRAEFAPAAALLDPFGLSAFDEATKNWAPNERNLLLPSMAGGLLRNRVLWLAIAFALLGVAWRSFRQEDRALPSDRQAAARATQDAEPQSTAPRPQAEKPASHRELGWGPLAALTRFDVMSVLRSPAYVVLLGIAFINAVVGLWYAGDDSVSVIFPVTRVMIQTLRELFTTFPLLIAAFYAGELVWRDRERRVFEIVDATPSSDIAFLLPKILAIAIVLFTMALMSVVAAVCVQALKGFPHFEFSHYLLWYMLPWLVTMMLYAVLAVFVQMLVPHKFVGLLVILLVLVAQRTLPNLGFDHSLYLYATTPPTPISDMNGQGEFARYAAWFRAYWAAFATILALLTYALWRRGESAPLKVRIQRLPRRLKGRLGWAVGAAAVVMAALGGYIYYNTNILNEYRPYVASERWAADYEKTLSQFEKLPQPRITDVMLKIDLFPDEPRVVTRGSYMIENRTGAPLKEVHISWVRAHEEKSFLGTEAVGPLELTSLVVPGARMTRDFPKFHYRIYTFDTPLAPGERREITFETVREQKGFRNSFNEVRVVDNGTFLDNLQLAPHLGVSNWPYLTGRAKRRQYGLPPEPGAPKLEDTAAREFHYLSHDSDWVNADLTVSTPADQTVLAPGKLIDTKVEGGRRISHFHTEAPILHFFSIQSARYAVLEDHYKDIKLAVYYHPAHPYDVQSMMNIMKEALDYYTTNFSPYQFWQLRIVEFPDYLNFAQSFPGTVAYSEAAGFIFDTRRLDKADLVTYVTAHESAHQWWFHHVISADMEGMTVLSETLAQYSALMVMERLHGPDNIHRFLREALDGYLRGRGKEPVEERPLERVDGQKQSYIGYQKGAVVMYLLKDQIGEETVNRALRHLLKDYSFKGPPYPRSRELVDYLREEAGPEHQQLITDLFQKITLYDLKVASAHTNKRADGKWDVTLDVDAHKLYADGKGVETEAPLDELIDIGVFSVDPSRKTFAKSNVLSIQKQRVQSGKHTYTVVVGQEPKYVGIDPYNKYIDRKPDDNLLKLEQH
jgi:ABC-2 type transport system permease protein